VRDIQEYLSSDWIRITEFEFSVIYYYRCIVLTNNTWWFYCSGILIIRGGKGTCDFHPCDTTAGEVWFPSALAIEHIFLRFQLFVTLDANYDATNHQEASMSGIILYNSRRLYWQPICIVYALYCLSCSPMSKRNWVKVVSESKLRAKTDLQWWTDPSSPLPLGDFQCAGVNIAQLSFFFLNNDILY